MADGRKPKLQTPPEKFEYALRQYYSYRDFKERLSELKPEDPKFTKKFEEIKHDIIYTHRYLKDLMRIYTPDDRKDMPDTMDAFINMIDSDSSDRVHGTKPSHTIATPDFLKQKMEYGESVAIQKVAEAVKEDKKKELKLEEVIRSDFATTEYKAVDNPHAYNQKRGMRERDVLTSYLDNNIAKTAAYKHTLSPPVLRRSPTIKGRRLDEANAQRGQIIHNPTRMPTASPASPTASQSQQRGHEASAQRGQIIHNPTRMPTASPASPTASQSQQPRRTITRSAGEKIVENLGGYKPRSPGKSGGN